MTGWGARLLYLGGDIDVNLDSTARNGPPPVHSPSAPLRGSKRKVIRGCGRGSKELGIPTTNLPVDNSLTPRIADIESGVYFGWASLRLPPSHPNEPTTSSDITTTTTTALEAHSESGFSVYPMVMSIGYNKVFKNTTRSAEVHMLHEFAIDFYGVETRLLIAGFIREEKDDDGLQGLALIEDRLDCDVARKSLDCEAWTLQKTGRGTLVADQYEGISK
ncbi:uncharacterized protein FIBRA_08982 [Fibroporia radiculosa]|uniref:Riboflavin kinase n=1 Tax=Fibroporia radiculosa TaxID=599839 RepID=J4GXQ9_9APHY|nr:uncharacterized protein FIBRA_08982 [Fibroporia radiculosa]CCM06695.1 predicted protein [Fibroporia radiculosa]